MSFPYFLYIGRISEEKGIAALLAIFSNLPHLKLLVVGDGNMREMVMKEYSRFDNIIFKPFANRSQIAAYYKNALAVIVPSVWYEVLPLVILEAISYNKVLYVYRTKNSYKMFSGIKGISLFKEGELIPLLENFKQGQQITDYRMIKKTIAPEFHLENLLRIYKTVNHEKKQSR